MSRLTDEIAQAEQEAATGSETTTEAGSTTGTETVTSKYAALFNWLRTCPALADLWSIGATEDVGVRVILPQGASEAVQYFDRFDELGGYECDITPLPSMFEDYQINCYQAYDAADSSAPEYNLNVLSLDDVQSIIDWITEQDEAESLPAIPGMQVVAVECNPRVPQIRYITDVENTVCYFITVRIRYVNRARGRSVYYECDD